MAHQRIFPKLFCYILLFKDEASLSNSTPLNSGSATACMSLALPILHFNDMPLKLIKGKDLKL